ncbi:MAG TPA: APC family permease [Thermomicrobiales bacterium]|nr:APC family permease [Thermomicrobiales bacterium]
MTDQLHGDGPERPARPAPVGYSPPAPAAAPPPRRRLRPDLEIKDAGEVHRGAHPGDRYVRISARTDIRGRAPRFEGWTAREPEPPKTAAGRMGRAIKRALIGRPLASSQAIHERLTKVKALAILSSDALSSVAYATEETLLVLVLAGAGALKLDLGIGVAIALLLAIVAFSYRQTIFGYPSGGGSYIVASDNLGPIPGLTAAAALLIDYVLTVAVSVSAGVLALTSAVPALVPYTVPLGLFCILLIMVGNLRGIRESGTIFAAPTYLFIGAMLLMLGIGFVRAFVLHDPAATGVPRPFNPRDYGVPQTLGIFLVLQAFSSGCSAMTGTEAISNGVPAFKPPEARNAATTLLWMAGLLGTMFLGTTILAHQYGLVPAPSGNPSLLSQLTEEVVGRGWFHPFYYVVQVATLLVLVLAANTSYADFPRLASILARDRFAPKLFGFRGDRLAFTVGIAALSVFAAILLVIFGGDTSALIPLYAVGVFVSFTLSQAGMVAHWRRERGRGWATKAAVNGVGAVATGIVAIIAGATKLISGEPLFRAFGHNVHAGSWIVIVLIPLLIALFLAIHRHYARAAEELAAETPVDPDAIRHTVIVPIAALNRVALQTLAYARSISADVTAVHVDEDPDAIAALREAWGRKAQGTPFLRDVRLVTIESPYRALTGPLLAYIDEMDRHDPADTLTVVLPEFVPAHWWEQLLHNQTALRLKAALLFRPGTVVINVPYHLERGSALGKARAGAGARRG